MEKAKGFLINHWKLIVTFVFVIVLSFVCGWKACVHFNKNIVEVPVTKVEVREVKVPVETQAKTEIQYVEKETPQDADVQITKPAPEVVVDYNGQQTKFETLDNETQKFDKGKLQVDQTSKVTLDVTPIVQKEVQTAVDQNTKEMTKAKDNEVAKVKSEETKKRHKHELGAFLTGAGVGALGVLLF